MPAKGSTLAGSRADRVMAWLEQNPGQHRCRDVAAAIGEDTQPVAVACRRFMDQGRLTRVKNGSSTTYGIPTPTP